MRKPDITGVMKSKKTDMRSSQMLEAFTAYCALNPEQRFFQALRNWMKVDALLAWKNQHPHSCWTEYERPFRDMGAEDTFYWEQKHV